MVLDKPAIQGKRFMPGEVLYQIADLSNVWMLADVFEQDLGMVQQGQMATIRIDAYPDKVFSGKVTFVYPMVKPETRTARVRIELPINRACSSLTCTEESSSLHSMANIRCSPCPTRQCLTVASGGWCWLNSARAGTSHER